MDSRGRSGWGRAGAWLVAGLASCASAGCAGAIVSLGDDAVPVTAADAGSSADADTSDDTTDGGATDSGLRPTEDDAGPTPALPFAGCSGPGGGEIVPVDAAAAEAEVVGVWLLCTSPSPFGTTDEVGIELLDTGVWYKMYNQGGLLVRGDASGELGTFAVEGVAFNGYFTVEFQVTGSSPVVDATHVTASPQRMIVGSTTYAFYVAPP